MVDEVLDEFGDILAPLGKRSFETADLLENLKAFMDHLMGMRPGTVKGTFVRKVSVSTSMGPGAAIVYGV